MHDGEIIKALNNYARSLDPTQDFLRLYVSELTGALTAVNTKGVDRLSDRGRDKLDILAQMYQLYKDANEGGTEFQNG